MLIAALLFVTSLMSLDSQRDSVKQEDVDREQEQGGQRDGEKEVSGDNDAAISSTNIGLSEMTVYGEDLELAEMLSMLNAPELPAKARRDGVVLLPG